MTLFGRKRGALFSEKKKQKTTVKRARHIAKNKLNLAKKVNAHVDQCLLKVPAKNLLKVSQNEGGVAMNWPPTSGVEC